MRPLVRTALALWTVLALAVFAVTFDWQTRVAGALFVVAQAERRAAQQPLLTIDNGFRPMVRAAALRASTWSLAVLTVGAGAVLFAARRQSNNAF